MRAAFKPGSINTDERTVEVVFGSDKPVRMWTWEYGQISEELSFDSAHVRMDRLNSGAPVLDNHDAYGSVLDTVVGVVEKAWTDGKKGYAKLRFAKTEKGDKMLEMALDGILQNVSVGYAVHKYSRTKAKEEGKLDHYRAIDWEPHEISMVSVPADFDAKLRSLAGPDNALTIEDEAGEAVLFVQTEHDQGRTPSSTITTSGTTLSGGVFSPAISTSTATLYRGGDMYGVDVQESKGQIEAATEVINELNEEIEHCAACSEQYPEMAELYAAAADAHKAAISVYLEIIAAVNGQRSTDKEIINQRRRELDILLARF